METETATPQPTEPTAPEAKPKYDPGPTHYCSRHGQVYGEPITVPSHSGGRREAHYCAVCFGDLLAKYCQTVA